MAKDRAQPICLVGRAGLGGGHRQGVGVHGRGVLARLVHNPHHEHTRRTPVVAFVDRAHPAGAHYAQHPRVQAHALGEHHVREQGPPGHPLTVAGPGQVALE